MKTVSVMMVILLFCFFSALANDSAQFELTEEKVDSAWLSEGPGGQFLVEVKLKEPYREYFSKLTASNMGNRLEITFSGKLLISPVVMSKIDSGIIQIDKWDSEEDARGFIEALLPKSKRGTIEGGECSKQTEAIRLRSKKALDMARDSLEQYALTKDRHHLVKGLELIEEVIEADKGYALGYYWKATMLAKLKEYEKANLALDQGIKESIKVGDEEVVNLYFMRGVLKQKTGGKGDALEDYEKTVRIYQERLKADPRNWDAIMNSSLVLVLMDRRREAIKLIIEKIEKYPEEEHLKQLLEDIKEFNVAIYLESL